MTDNPELQQLAEALAQSLYISSQGWSKWPTLDEIAAGVKRALDEPEPVAVFDELKRHRDTNLVRAVMREFDERPSEIIHDGDFDRIPWRVAEHMKAERDQTRADLEAQREVAEAFDRRYINLVREHEEMRADLEAAREALRKTLPYVHAAMTAWDEVADPPEIVSGGTSL